MDRMVVFIHGGGGGNDLRVWHGSWQMVVNRGDGAEGKWYTYFAIDAQAGLEALEEFCWNRHVALPWLRADHRRSASIAAC